MTFCKGFCHACTQFTCPNVWGKLHVICNGFGRFTPPESLYPPSFLIGERSAAKMFIRSPVMLAPLGDSTPSVPVPLAGFVFPRVRAMRH